MDPPPYGYCNKEEEWRYRGSNRTDDLLLRLAAMQTASHLHGAAQVRACGRPMSGSGSSLVGLKSLSLDPSLSRGEPD